MADSHIVVFIHFVWATKYRQDVITPELEEDLYNVIGSEVRRLKCEPIALNGMPNYVHLLIGLGRNVGLGKVMNQVKGVSSSYLNDRMFPEKDGYFRWQAGYSAFSVSANHVTRVTNYIRNQKAHHSSGNVWDRWEETPEDE